MADYCFIVNPVAGGGSSLDTFAPVQALLRERGTDHCILRSEYPGHATVLANEAKAAGHGCIVAVGGDGTALEVARVLLHTGVPMGLLPCGSGNDLAKALHIPDKDVMGAFERLLSQPPRAVDAALANGVPYCNVAGLGWDVDVLENTERYKEKHSGRVAYLLGLFRSLFQLKLRTLRVTSAERSLEGPALLLAAANGTHYGAGMPVAPLADPADGLLDVCVIRNINRFNLLFILPKFLKGKHVGLHKYVEYWKTRSVTIEAVPTSRLQLDGEILYETPVTFEIAPGALIIKG